MKALTGLPGAFRVLVGDCRVVSEIEDHQLVVLILALGHRREVYRDI